MIHKCKDCKYYVDQPRAHFDKTLGSCTRPTPNGRVRPDNYACKYFESKEPVLLSAAQARLFRIQQEIKKLEKELDELEEALRGDKNES